MKSPTLQPKLIVALNAAPSLPHRKESYRIKHIIAVSLARQLWWSLVDVSHVKLACKALPLKRKATPSLPLTVAFHSKEKNLDFVFGIEVMQLLV